MTTLDKRQSASMAILVGIICEMLNGAAEQGKAEVPTSSFIMGMMLHLGQHPDNVVQGIRQGFDWGLITFHPDNVFNEQEPPESISLSAKGRDRLADLIGYLDTTEPIIKAAHDAGEEPDFDAFPPTPTFD